MDNFLDKYYPGIKRTMHKQNIINLYELLEKERKAYEEKYHVKIVM